VISDATARSTQRENLKQADLLCGIGALVLGMGIGALATPALGWFAVPLLLISCLSHGWIMIQKHRIEQLNASGSAAWETALYWGCWAAIAIVLAIASWKALIHARTGQEESN